MKKIFILLCFFLSSVSLQAQIFVENFVYEPSEYLFQTGNWFNDGPPENAIQVMPPGLSFPGYIGSGIGNAAGLASYGSDVHSVFTQTESDGSVYASFMLQVIFPFVTNDYFIGIRGTDGDTYARVHINQHNSNAFRLAVTKSGQSVPHFDTLTFDAGPVYLLVIKYKFVSGSNNDEVSLYVIDPSSPIPPVEPSPTILPESNNVPDAPGLNGIELSQGAAVQSKLMMFVDGIYVYNAWLPEPTLPVELSSFNSSVNGNNVTLNWSTAQEINNSHFEIERSSNDVWNVAGRVQGSGSTSTATSYSFIDRNLAAGKYKYRLKQTDINGNYEYHYLDNEVIISAPSNFVLGQNYPNPFNPVTKISYEILEAGFVSIKVFDVNGREAIEIVNGDADPGYYSVSLDASALAAGIYFYSIRFSNGNKELTQSRKMMIIK